MPQLLLGLIFLFLSVTSYSQTSRQSVEELAKDKQWVFLMHYLEGKIIDYKGLATAKEFYLSEEGRYQPVEELKALIASAELPASDYKKMDDHPRCKFPFRYNWLKSKGYNFQWPKSLKCEKYEQYKRRHEVKSVAIAFSAYNVSSPSSAFGHTLIRISKEKNKDKNIRETELLDYGVNFAAAIPEGTNPVWYAIGGMSGFFSGLFSSVPYYYKVREYNDFEARDIWTYGLSLTQKEMDDLVDHLYELGGTGYDYYFLTENCAYYVLRAVEAVAPRYSLIENMPYWVIPGDTIRVLSSAPGLVSHIEYRPSIRTQFEHRISKMNKDDRKLVYGLANNNFTPEVLKTRSEADKRDLLDAAIDFIELENPNDQYEQSSETLKIRHRLLLARASNNLKSPKLKIEMPMNARPHLGHESARASLGYGHSNAREGFASFDMKFALHDVLDSEIGYMKNAEVAFFHTKANYYNKSKKWELDSFSILEVVALPPYRMFQQKKAWKLRMGVQKRYDRNCGECIVGGIDTSFGRAYELDNDQKLLGYGLLQIEAKLSSNLPAGDILFGVGPNLGLLYHFDENTKLNLDGLYIKNIGSQRKEFYQSSLRYRKSIKRNFSLEVGGTHSEYESTTNFKLHFYF